MNSIAARYQIILKDQHGENIAVFDDWDSLSITEELNGRCSYQLSFLGNTDKLASLFELDGQLEFYRSVPGCGVDWYREFEAFHRKTSDATDDNGEVSFVSEGVGYNDLLARTVIAYDAGTIRSDKNDRAATVMSEYVNENCGSLAALGGVVGRLSNGVLPNFTVSYSPYDVTVAINQSVWTGSAAYENLLETLQDIAALSKTDFQVYGDGKASFIFKAYPDLIGADRTSVGLVPSTGLNASGNSPAIFAISMGNASTMSYTHDRLGEANVAIVLGSGDISLRYSVTRRNEVAIAASPWNRCEVSRSAGGYDQDFETYSLQVEGDRILEELKAKETFEFTPLQMPSMLYGKHYFLGDRVTAIYKGIEFHHRIIAVKLSVSGQEEKISLTFAESYQNA